MSGSEFHHSLGSQQGSSDEEIIKKATPGANVPMVDKSKPAESETITSKKRSRKASKPRSEVWAHFDRIKKHVDTSSNVEGDEEKFDKCKCRYCGAIYSCNSGTNGTSGLWKHYGKCKKKPLSTNSQTELCFGTNKDGEGALTAWKFDEDASRRELALMIMEVELPFRLVEHPRFRSFCRSLQPKFHHISRTTSRRDVFGVFEDEKSKLKSFLRSSTQGICLTMDTWTSIKGMSYMSLTAHFIDDGWTLRKKILNFCPVISHKGEVMGRLIEKCLKEWGVSRILTCTVDNASANDHLVKYLKGRFGSVMQGENMHMRCVAHIINLIVSDGLKDSNVAISRVRDAVKYVRASSNRVQKFKECVEAEGIQSKSLLCLDVCTRWNSTYLMLEAAQKFEKAFERFEEVEPQISTELEGSGVGMPNGNDWAVVRRLVAFLRHFYDLTCKVSGTSYITSSNLFHELNVIYGVLQDWKVGEDREMSAMAGSMLTKCDKYWGGLSNKLNILLFVTIVLDPRYKLKFVDLAIKDLYLGEIGEGVATKVRDITYKLFNEYKNSVSHGESASRSVNENNLLDMDTLTPQDRVRAKLKRLHSQVGGGTSVSELDKYLSEGIEEEDDNYDILRWWSIHRTLFPTLAVMARDLLAIPVSTVASESVFSNGGRVLNSFRSSLTPQIAEALICGTDWVRSSSDLSTIDDMEEDLEDQEHFENEIAKKGKSS